MSCEAHALAESRKEIDGGTVDLLRRLAADLPSAGTVVDLGTGSGTALLAILAERNDAIHIHSYDLDVQWGQAVVNNERVSRVGDVTFYRGDILADEVQFRGEHGVDLLLVDLLPEHTHEILSRWLPRLNPRARVWVHNADLVMVQSAIEAITAEGDGFPIETLDTRGRSWTGAIKEITLGTVEERSAEDESGSIANPSGTAEVDDDDDPPEERVVAEDPKGEEVPSSPKETKQPKQAPKKRSRKSTE